MKNESFENVVKKLRRKYNYEIYITNNTLYENNFTATIQDETLKEVLELIKLTTPITYQIKDKEVFIGKSTH